MAWFGEITHAQVQSDGWKLVVVYYNDVEPDAKFPRSITLPLSTTKPQAVAKIKALGVEIMEMIKLADEKIVGAKIPIP